MAVAERAPFAGRWSPLINENFATMADVYRILGQLPDGADQMTTADGRAKTIEASRARLARMVGCDADDADAAWRMLAQWFAERQIRTIVDGAMLVLSSARVPADAPLLGAGIGEAIVQEVALVASSGGTLSFGSVLDVAPSAREQASHCAPAAALAALASMSTRGAVGTESGRAVG